MQKSKKQKILIYDAAEGGFLGASWRLGASMLGLGVDYIIAAHTVKEAMRKLDSYFNLCPEGETYELQVWGHGYDGMPLIDGKPIGHDESVLGNLDTLWLRSCYVMRGEAGANFAAGMARQEVDVVGHTCIIGYWGMHSGLVGLRHKDGTPWWERDAFPQTSAPWAPRTIPATAMSIPEWAYGPK